MVEDNFGRGPIRLDWNAMIDQYDEEPPSLVIEKSAGEPVKFLSLSYRGLEETLKRQHTILRSVGDSLPDKGDKIRAYIKALEDEAKGREIKVAEMDAEECERHAQSMKLNMGAPSNGFRRESTSQAQAESQFAYRFCRKFEERSDCGSVQAFEKELSTIGSYNTKKMLSNGGPLERKRKKHQLLYGPWKDACQLLPSNSSRTRLGQIVVVDEDEEPLVDAVEHTRNTEECMKDTKIYYPSCDDPESIEICYKDIHCLSPRVFLASPIMNFYIRYLRLQASPTNGIVCDYHIFNTFFYKKLKQAVSYKVRDKESFFVKFRRWWKGVNIFQKAYILIPIHEDASLPTRASMAASSTMCRCHLLLHAALATSSSWNLHWSLVIICIPHKEDDSGPIVLHLDSLGLHYSKLVFHNIKRYLIEEWKYMAQEEASLLDLPISARIWKHLPRRIDEKSIMVPQQNNKYDCGLFVLFFMEKFIEEAPKRLRKKDLAMFGKKWFQPEEASSLRVKIKKLLIHEFQIANGEGRLASDSFVPC